jgi:hypothetical protein
MIVFLMSELNNARSIALILGSSVTMQIEFLPIPAASQHYRPANRHAGSHACDTIDIGRLTVYFSPLRNSVCFMALVSELEEMRSQQPDPSVNISKP